MGASPEVQAGFVLAERESFNMVRIIVLLGVDNLWRPLHDGVVASRGS